MAGEVGVGVAWRVWSTSENIASVAKDRWIENKTFKMNNGTFTDDERHAIIQ